MPDYLVQGDDGTSKFTLGDGSGFLLLAVSADTVLLEPFRTGRIAPTTSGGVALADTGIHEEDDQE